MIESISRAGSRVAVWSIVAVLLLSAFALPAMGIANARPLASSTGSLGPLSNHLQQNWEKTHSAAPAPLTNCQLPPNLTGDDCYNPGTTLTWTLALDICTSSSQVCDGSSQQTITLTSVDALLPPGESYVPGSQTYATLPANPATFAMGSCSAAGAPAECALAPTDTYLEWNFSAAVLNGHPQAVFTYQGNVSGPDASPLTDIAVAHYSVVSLPQNPPASDEVAIAYPILAIQKSCPLAVENNSAIGYTVVLTNTGHQDATGVAVSDPAPAGVTFLTASGSAGTTTLASNAVGWTGTIPADGSVTISIGGNVATAAASVTNVAGYTAFPPAAVVNEPSAACPTNVLHPAIHVTKTVHPTTVSNLTANTIAVVANVTNTGDTPLSGITVFDTFAALLTCPSTSLGPGAWMLCAGSYTLPQGVSASWSNDTVTATGTDPLGTSVTDTANAAVRIVHPSVALTKTVDPTLVSDLVANSIAVSTVVTNTGDATLTGIAVTDSLAGPLSCPADSLAAGDSMTCTGSYVIPAGDPQGWSNDTATVVAYDPFDNPVSASASASVQILHPSIAIVKTVSPTVVSNLVPQTISVTAVVTNTGDSLLGDLVVTDSLAGPLSCPGSTLGPGQSMTCTGAYVIPAGAGAAWSNDTATVTGQDPLDNDLSASASASVQILHPAISIVKTVSPTVVSDLTSQTISVTAVVSNPGDAPLSGLGVVDTLAGPLNCPADSLAAGDSMTCTGSYVIPAGDPQGWSNDTATVVAYDPFDNPVSASASASVQILHPSIAIVKTVSPTVVSNLVANTISVTAVVTNTGDAPISNVAVLDSLAGPLNCPASTLAAGGTMTCTGAYVIPAGYALPYSNDTATVTGQDPFGNPVSATASASVEVLHPAISIAKSVSPTMVSDLTANTILVTAVVTNPSDSALSGIGVTDSLAGTLSCPSATLPAGQSMTCTGSYVIPAGAPGTWSNDTATVVATDQFGNPLSATASASVRIVHPSIGVTKSVSPTLVSDLSSNTIDVQAVVTNTGDATLAGIGVTDTLAGPLSCPSDALPAGQSMTCTGSYVIPAGEPASWSNDTVTVVGYDAFDNPVSATASASVQIVHPALSATKSVTPTLVSDQVANTILVTAVVTNTGDATLSGIGVTDTLAGPLACPSTTLSVGESMTCTGSYVIPTGEPASWSNDTVTAVGHDAFGNPVSATASASVQVIHPSIAVAKSVSPTLVSDLTPNTIDVQAVVTNTGDWTLSGLYVVDTLAGVLTCPSDTLPAGQSMTCTGSYVIPAGEPASWSNDTVSAQGVALLGGEYGLPVGPVTASASVQIVHPAISIVKTVSPTTVSDVTANPIFVSALVTNTGDVTLTGIAVTDSLAGALSCPASSLLAGGSMVCTGSYGIPAGDAQAWSNDTATVVAYDPFDNPLDAGSSASVQIVHPSIHVTKSVDPTSVVGGSDHTINVTAVVTNTGDTGLSGLSVVDTLAGTLACPSTTLAPGASMTCTGSYTIFANTTAAYSNDTVTASGQDGYGHTVNDSASASVEITHPGSSFVTDTTFCPLPGELFRLVLTGSTAGQLKLSSTNPGQFYYNVISNGGMAHGATLTITIPYPFVTQGAVPIQVFENQGVPTCPRSVPSANINGQFAISPHTFGLSAYSPPNLGSTETITLTLTGASIPAGAVLWFAVHLDYALKGATFHAVALGASGCASPPNTGACIQLASNPSVVIGNPQPYAFANSLFGTNPISSYNGFNRPVALAAGVAPAASWTAAPLLGVSLGGLLGLFAVVPMLARRARARGARSPEGAAATAAPRPASLPSAGARRGASYSTRSRMLDEHFEGYGR